MQLFYFCISELRSWCEVPSIAHFCSLFRAAFDLPDFDIEVIYFIMEFWVKFDMIDIAYHCQHVDIHDVTYLWLLMQLWWFSSSGPTGPLSQTLHFPLPNIRWSHDSPIECLICNYWNIGLDFSNIYPAWCNFNFCFFPIYQICMYARIVHHK